MKKLLSTLMATTLTVSALGGVVACTKKLIPDEESKESDFMATKNALKELTQIIFNENLRQDFDDYLFISPKGGDNGVTFPFSKDREWIEANQEAISKVGTPEFKLVCEDIGMLVNFIRIEEQIKEKILGNVNFRSLIINGKSPLIQGYEIKNLIVTTSNDVISINISIGALFTFKNALGKPESEQLDIFKANINILDPEMDIDALNDLKQKYKDTINGSIGANEFVIKSDRGNLEKSAAEIDLKTPDNLAYQSLDKLVNDLNQQFVDKNIAIADEYKIETNKNIMVDASTSYSDNRFDWDTPETESIVTLKDALMGDKLAEEKLINEISSNYSEWMPNNTGVALPNIGELVKEYPDMAAPFNSFNLEYNQNLHLLFNEYLVNSEFSVTPELEQNYIALFGADITNVKITYKNEAYFDLPIEQIGIKQRTLSNTSLDLLKKFNQTAFEFNKLFYNFDESSSNENNPDFIYYLNRPESWTEIEPKTQIDCEQALEELIGANSLAYNKLQELSLSVGMSLNNDPKFSRVKYISFNEAGDVYFYNDLTNKNLFPRLRVYFYSNSFDSIKGKYDFSFNHREHFNIKVVNESISGWKFKD